MSRRSFEDPHGTSDAARRALLDNRNEHAPKNHRTRKRSKALSKKKRVAIAHHNAVAAAMRSKKRDAALAYWRGEKPEHPTK